MKHILEFQKFNEQNFWKGVRPNIYWHISQRENLAITLTVKPSDISYYITPMLQEFKYDIIYITSSKKLHNNVIKGRTCNIIFYDELDRTSEDINRIKEIADAGYFIIILTSEEHPIPKKVAKYFEPVLYDEWLTNR